YQKPLPYRLATPQQIKPKQPVARPYSRFEPRAQSPNHEIPPKLTVPTKNVFNRLSRRPVTQNKTVDLRPASKLLLPIETVFSVLAMLFLLISFLVSAALCGIGLYLLDRLLPERFLAARMSSRSNHTTVARQIGGLALIPAIIATM